MTVVVDETPKAGIQALLDMEGLPNTVLLIDLAVNDPEQFEFGTSISDGNIDVSPSGLPVYITPAADRPGTYRLNLSGQTITLTEEP